MNNWSAGIPMKNRIRHIISSVFMTLFLLWAGWYIVKHWNDFKSIINVPLLNLLTLYGIFMASLFCSGLYTKYIIAVFGPILSIRESFKLSVATAAANYMTFFRGGAGVRALYLKTNYRLAFADFLSALSAMYLMHFVVNGLMGLWGMIILYFQGKPFDLPFSIFFAASGLFSAAIILIRIRLPAFDKFPLREIARVINGWELIRQNKIVLQILFANTILYFLIFVFQTKIAFSCYGIDLSWGASIFYTAGRIPVSFATITPGAIGILEGFTIYMGKTFNYSTADALMVQMLLRFITISTLIAAGPWAIAQIGAKPKQELDEGAITKK